MRLEIVKYTGDIKVGDTYLCESVSEEGVAAFLTQETDLSFVLILPDNFIQITADTDTLEYWQDFVQNANSDLVTVISENPYIIKMDLNLFLTNTDFVNTYENPTP